MKKLFLVYIAYYLLLALFDATNSSSQGTWTQKADFGGGIRNGAVGFSIGKKGYIGTGWDGSINYQDLWEWDQTTNIWTQKADFGGGTRSWSSAFSIGTKGYIVSGSNGSGPYTFYNDIWEWDQSTNTWMLKANFSATGRFSSIAFSIGLKGYMGTGNYFNGSSWIAYKDFWEWDQTSDTWTQKANFVTATTGAVGFSIGSKGYVLTADTSNNFWEWNQTTNLWVQKANFGGVARGGMAGFSIGTQGFVGCGEDNLKHNDFWEWNQTTNSWIQKANFGGTARNRPVGFPIGTFGYMGTGAEGIYVPTKDFWEYCDTCIVGVNETENQISIYVFPNPFSTQTTFSINGQLKMGNGKYIMYDAFGKEVKKLSIVNFPFSIERGGLPNGVYFYQITEKEKSMATGKLIIQ